MHGVGDSQSASADSAAIGDPFVSGLPRYEFTTHIGAGQGYLRKSRRCRSCEDATPSGCGNNGLGKIGRDKRDDSVVALQIRTSRRAFDNGRSENAGVVGVCGYSPPSRAGGHRHEAGVQRTDVVCG